MYVSDLGVRIDPPYTPAKVRGKDSNAVKRVRLIVQSLPSQKE